MRHEAQLPRGCLLVIADLTDIEWATEKLSNHNFVCVLAARKLAEFDECVLNPEVADRLMAAGCEYFVIFGPESAEAHDALDWYVEGIGKGDVITTWHDDEPPYDVANFAFSICTLDKNRKGLMAILDDHFDEDRRMAEALRGLETEKAMELEPE